jgi:uncharacterized protein (TIGR02145 family)
MKSIFRTLVFFLTLLVWSTGIASAQQEHEYVDLALPSGTLWATCNIGADNPWDPGDYFAWGETASKPNYDWQFYQYADGNYDKLIKYCNNQSFGNDGYTDRLKVLEDADDAANAIWGAEWHIPTVEQFKELMDNCTNEWTVSYNGKGVAGRIFKSKKNGNEVFFPAAGYNGRDGRPTHVGNYGFYWSSSLCMESPSNAPLLYFHSGYVGAFSNNFRYYGQTMRAVRKIK